MLVGYNFHMESKVIFMETISTIKSSNTVQIIRFHKIFLHKIINYKKKIALFSEKINIATLNILFVLKLEISLLFYFLNNTFES